MAGLAVATTVQNGGPRTTRWGLEGTGRQAAGAAALLALIAVTGPAAADESGLVVVGAAAWSKGRDAVALDLQYRPAWSLIPVIEPWAGLRPFAAALVSMHSQLWAGAGLMVEVPIGRLRLAVGSGPGLYVQGDGQDLGNDLVFRSQAELSWRFEGGWRVAVSAMHLSNAGLGDHNPGSDLIGASLEIPIGGL